MSPILLQEALAGGIALLFGLLVLLVQLGIIV